jgi:hypothetical protein
MLGNVKLWVLLAVTERLIRRGRRHSARIREMLDGPSFVFQICTEAGAGGYFEVRSGDLRLRRGRHPSPDFTQTWADGHAAFAALTSGDETDVLRAFEAGTCRMAGSFLLALWFNEAVKISRAIPLAATPS